MVKSPSQRTRDPEATRARILAAAKAEFARKGLGGARVDDIAARAKANKRMLYHYFGNKEDLFRITLEDAYADFRAAEARLEIEKDDPITAIKRLVSFTWKYYLDNPEFITLVNSENLHKARHIRNSKRMREMSRPFVGRMRDLLERGAAAGLFRADLDPVQVNITIAAIGLLLPHQPLHRIDRLRTRPDERGCTGAARRLQHPDHSPDGLHTGDARQDRGQGMTGSALVTGARRGIGKAIALALADAGFDVAVADVAASEELEAVAEAIRGRGRKAAAIAGDIAAVETHAILLDAAEQALGPLTTLVNNAGVSVLSRGDLLDVTPESYDRCDRVNARGTFFLTQAFARRLLGRASDTHRSIIVISSANAAGAVDRPRRILHLQGRRLDDLEALCRAPFR